MKLDTLQRLYLNELRELYYAEQQLLRLLPAMAKAASSDSLREGLEKHHELTPHHIERLEQVFVRLNEKPQDVTGRGIKGLIEDAFEMLRNEGEKSVLDAAIAVSGQKIEHYQIAGYGAVVAFADMLGHDEAVTLLQATLDEEAEMNELLSSLTEEVVTPEVLMETELGRQWSKSLSELLS